MKKLFLIIAAAVTVTVQAQVTNLVKISALPTVSSLSGTEPVPLVQGGVTKTATVAQLNAVGVAAASLVANAVVATNTLIIAALNTASNVLATANATNAATAASQLAGTNTSLVSNITTASNTLAAATAALTATITANATAASTALQATNTAIQAQLTTLTLGSGASIPSGGNGTLASLTATNEINPSIDKGAFTIVSGSTLNFNLNNLGGYNQRAYFNSGNGAYLYQPTLTNMTDGAQINLYITVSGAGCYFNYTASPTGYRVHGAVSNMQLLGGSLYIANWLTIGTNIIFGIQSAQ